LRLVFMGNPAFALPSLERLYNDRHEIAAVVTNPDSRAGRGRMPRAPEVKSRAEELNLEVVQPAELTDVDFIRRMESIAPELFVVVAFRILPERLLNIPSAGSVNLHASLLPRYRGAAPINWAIINGETETGVSTFFLKPRVDTGDIIMRRKVEIGPDTTYGELYDRLSRIGADILSETVRRIENGTAAGIKQDHSQATPAPKITPGLCRIDFSKRCRRVVNLIRGLSPKPGAFSVFRGKKIKILRAERFEGQPGGIPGRLHDDPEGKGVLVACEDGYIRILSLQVEGKKVMTGKAFVNGYHPESGEIMGDGAV
jgi:methionyl-tRNA formyltransferase